MLRKAASAIGLLIALAGAYYYHSNVRRGPETQLDAALDRLASLEARIKAERASVRKDAAARAALPGPVGARPADPDRDAEAESEARRWDRLIREGTSRVAAMERERADLMSSIRQLESETRDR